MVTTVPEPSTTEPSTAGSSTGSSTGLSTGDASTGASSVPSRHRIEMQGIDVIAEADRHGSPRSLFWPWCAGNISVLSVSWGAYLFDFGISFGQALLVTLVGVVGSFLLVGLVSLVGQRGSAPTMVLSRAVFGVHGNILPGIVSYLLLLGWEIVLTSMAVLSSQTVADRLGLGGGGVAKVAVFAVVVAVTVVLGVIGFDAVMKAQRWITVATLVMTAVFMAMTLDHINLSQVTSHPAGGAAAVLGAAMMVFAGFGVGWTSAAADYSRYLPRHTSGRSIVGWTTFGGSLPVVVLIGYGLLLCGSDPTLSKDLASDPIGALTSVLPTWFVVPFWLVALTGLVAGTIMDLYSSGLALVAIGLPIKRWVAAGVDGVLVTLGTIYVAWFASDFLTPFQGFLITLAVPLAAWTGIFCADLVNRWREGYDESRLFDSGPTGYGSIRWFPVAWLVLTCVVGFGLVTNSNANWLSWQGYLLAPFGLGGKDGPWAYASLGVLVALALGFLGQLVWIKLRARLVG